jgi:phosphoribosylformylglycinamidine synthase
LREIAGREEGAPPPVDLAIERRNGEFVRALIGEGRVTAVHDVSDGGLLVAIAEMAMASGIGARLYGEPMGTAAHAFWFGEDQARYVITAKQRGADAIVARCKTADIPVRRIGSTAGNALMLPGQRPILLAKLNERFEGFLPAYMAGAH